MKQKWVLISLIGLSAWLGAQAQAADCNNVAGWQSGTGYNAGGKVVQANQLYEAKWYTVGEQPAANSWSAWNPLGACAAAGGVKLILRQHDRTLSLAPGQEDFVASACEQGEVPISGGPSGISVGPSIVYSTMSWDGNRGGWLVQYRNNTNAPITSWQRVGVTCAAGSITIAP
ncbi:hypothetical protein [Chitinolyticbacter albus]|uniref:hypothetical protein n=1 Tax=Chitinolyticbacter albus TaxID=2961951 RepID=UPI00210D0BD1|nr:hypothetical protein [Chitinolyticbacter albus]